ncbi:tail completion protein gp17 [Bacteroides congonensis]|uniref:tail completion protein gp17 n=1 Tax=Bacteroides congonensis TaxID=1871006 RepID=UPI0009352454|nr:DUF3168 domain-containing protein [Bacteroides congonensis]
MDNVTFYPSKLQTKFSVCTLIRERLLADEKIKELVGTQIYPIIAPEGTTNNYIVYVRDEYSIDRTKVGIAFHNCIVFISCVSSSYDESQKIADAVFQTLDGKYKINSEQHNINAIELVDSTEDYDGDVYIQTLSFSIK